MSKRTLLGLRIVAWLAEVLIEADDLTSKQRSDLQHVRVTLGLWKDIGHE